MKPWEEFIALLDKCGPDTEFAVRSFYEWLLVKGIVREPCPSCKEHEAAESRIMEILEIRYDLPFFEDLRLGDIREVVDLIRTRRARQGKG
jgi:CRISPR/Cas system-associated exonuclease Cas4 (RecB family)